jgi:membrane associated rhomboid family serine protease
MFQIRILLISLACSSVHARHHYATAPNKHLRQQLKLRGGNIYEQNPDYNHASPTLGELDSNGYYRSTALFGAPTMNNRKPPPIIKLILEYFTSLHEFSPTLSYGTYASILLFMLWQFSPSSEVNKALQKHFVCSRRNIQNRRYHTLITSAFSHASLHHLAVNLYAFLTFGPGVARVLSSQSVEVCDNYIFYKCFLVSFSRRCIV